ncbi:hypothetical protein BGX38DRAFT_1139786 [Terfezia claveryi]|nr:hypothetical protein BGX38DRAFT_1139786 [Terfezia claveryi]
MLAFEGGLAWQQINSTVGGMLIADIRPISFACYKGTPDYNKARRRPTNKLGNLPPFWKKAVTSPRLTLGRTVVVGAASTVGVTGGYIQGGGHSLGRGWRVEFEVVLADGSIFKASACTNSDLFWALRGGGGSTYGAVTSVVLRTHENVSMVQYFLNIIGYLFFFGQKDTKGVEKLFKPFHDWLYKAVERPFVNVTISPAAPAMSYPNYARWPRRQHCPWIKIPFPGTPRVSKTQQNALRDIDYVGPGPKPVDSAAHSAWRKAIAHIVVSINWEQGDSFKKQDEVKGLMSDYIVPRLKKLDYWHEDGNADYGVYGRLKKMKAKYDPNGEFWCRQCFGSEDWDLDGIYLHFEPQEPGSLGCSVKEGFVGLCGLPKEIYKMDGPHMCLYSMTVRRDPTTRSIDKSFLIPVHWESQATPGAWDWRQVQGYIGNGKANPTKRAQLTATDSRRSSQYASIGR